MNKFSVPDSRMVSRPSRSESKLKKVEAVVVVGQTKQCNQIRVTIQLVAR